MLRIQTSVLAKNRLRIGPIKAIDGTPVVDIKPALV
jgi:tRNA (Thr-GGU) A37 N-methylase